MEANKLVSREIRIKLSDYEVLERSRKLAEAMASLQAAEEEQKQFVQQFKSKVSEQKLEITRLREVVRSGKENQNREVEMKKEFEKNRVIYILNGEIVDERVMEARERQMELDEPPIHDPGEQEESENPRPKADHKMLAANDKEFAEGESVL